MSADVVRLRSNSQGLSLSDAALARACASRDPAAIAALFDRFRQPVARYLRRLLETRADIDDALQTTFVEIARGHCRYDEERGSVLVWLFAIATHVVRHHRRATARRLRLLSALAEAEAPEGVAVGDQVQARRDLEAARRALFDLSEERREAFVLCVLEGFSARDAASVTGVKESLVWKRASDARRRIREHVSRGRR